MPPPITDFLGELSGYNIPLYVYGGSLGEPINPEHPLSVSSGITCPRTLGQYMGRNKGRN